MLKLAVDRRANRPSRQTGVVGSGLSQRRCVWRQRCRRPATACFCLLLVRCGWSQRATSRQTRLPPGLAWRRATHLANAAVDHRWPDARGRPGWENLGDQVVARANLAPERPEGGAENYRARRIRRDRLRLCPCPAWCLHILMGVACHDVLVWCLSVGSPS